MARDRLTLLVDNEIGALLKIAALIAGRNCNIESIVSAPAEDSSQLLLTLEVSGSGTQVPRLRKLLAKLIPVHEVVPS